MNEEAKGYDDHTTTAIQFTPKPYDRHQKGKLQKTKKTRSLKKALCRKHKN